MVMRLMKILCRQSTAKQKRREKVRRQRCKVKEEQKIKVALGTSLWHLQFNELLIVVEAKSSRLFMLDLLLLLVVSPMPYFSTFTAKQRIINKPWKCEKREKAFFKKVLSQLNFELKIRASKCILFNEEFFGKFTW